ncbi:Por secretion system C-terminal sorting domain-containing protein [Flavobacteriaceae bacterium MAR_2010_188]|nr:Por secretion system C-terminal sorting domain-containing protein [Flavobacteriaceae bacterium MAR_2010_188]
MKHTLLACLLLVFSIAELSAQITFQSKTNITTATGVNPYVMTSGNLNSDDLKDIVVVTRTGNTIEWYKNDLNNSGNFIKQTNITTTLTTIIGVNIADLNNDGFNDIIASGGGNNKLAWYPNNQSGGFGGERIISGVLTGPGHIVTGKIDANSSIDVAVADYGANSVLWFANDGSGTFSSANTVVNVPNSGPLDLDMADFDGDGDLDVVVAYNILGTVELYDNKLIQTGSVSFTKYDNTVSTGSDYIFDVSFADVNDDDILDIIKADVGGAGDATYYTTSSNTTSTTFNGTALTTSLTRIATATVADFNNDGYNDVLITSAQTTGADAVILESNNDGTFKPETIIADGLKQVYSVTVADFGNDGDQDIAMLSYQDSSIYFSLNNLIALGLDDANPNAFKLYPNPTANELTLQSNNNLVSDYTIFNNLGQKIISSALDVSKKINVSSLEAGLYFLKLNNYAETFKFIKE